MIFQKKSAKALLAYFCILNLLFLFTPLVSFAQTVGISVNQSPADSNQNIFHGRITKASVAGSLMLLQGYGSVDEFRIGNDGSVNLYNNTLTTTGKINSANYCDASGNNCFTALSGGSDGYIGDSTSHTAGGSLNMNGNKLITGSGNIGIGSTNPSYRLDVQGTAMVDNLDDNGTSAFYVTRTGGTTQGLKVYANDRSLYSRYIEDSGEPTPGTWHFINELDGGDSYEFMTARSDGGRI